MLASLVGSPLVVVAVHACLERATRSRSPQRTAMIACVVAALPVVWMSRHATRDLPGATHALAYAVATYACIAYSYFHLFNMSETARRIRILRELLKSGSMGERELREHYTETDVIDIRIDRLVAMGQLREQGGRYVLSGSVLYLAARVVLGWRALLGYGPPQRDRS